MSTIDEIKARIDIVDLVSETVQLRRSGKNYTGFCPFHANSRTPAFAVFADSGTWRCFGQCNEGGDIFRYVMKKEGWDFAEALRYLAEKAGVVLHAPTAEERAAEDEHNTLRNLLEEAVIFYRHHLLSTQAGKPALDYLQQKRGLSTETIEQFGLGYAPPGWELASTHFREKGYQDQELMETGLVSVRDDSPPGGRSGVYDRFRHRIMFPIRDERGRMAGFGARILNPEDVPKFLNSPQGPLFDKGRLLYGLDRARKAIRELDQAVIVEGYLDVIALHQAGFYNIVSPMGTALTGYQLGLLKRASRRIVLALDPDAAGSQATLRGLQVARQTMDHTSEMVFDAHGLLGQEARLEADIRVTTLPDGQDPDEVVQQDPQLWSRLVAEARPIVIHVMETLAAGRNMDDPKVKTDLANQVLPLIEDVPSPIERDTYRQRLARLLKVSERVLLEMMPRTTKPGSARPGRRETGPPRPRGTNTPAPGTDPASGSPEQPSQAPGQAQLPTKFITGSGYALEAHCLGVLLRKPDLIYQADRMLQTAGLPRLTAEDFHHADHQTIFSLLHESIDQDMAEPLNYVLGSLSLDMMESADEMLSQTASLDPGEEKVSDDLLRGILDLRRRSLYQDLDYIRFLQEETGDNALERVPSLEETNTRSREYRQMVVQFTHTKMLIDLALGRFTGRVSSSH